MPRRRDTSAIFMNSTLVAKIAKNRLEEIRISVLRNNMVDMRMYFFFPQEPEAKPTKKGLWLSFKHIPAIVSELEKLVKKPDGEFQLQFDTKREQIRAYTGEYMKKKLVHIRTFFLRNGEYAPGKGIAFPAALADQVAAALKETEKHRDKKSL